VIVLGKNEEAGTSGIFGKEMKVYLRMKPVKIAACGRCASLSSNCHLPNEVNQARTSLWFGASPNFIGNSPLLVALTFLAYPGCRDGPQSLAGRVPKKVIIFTYTRN
jgi:hypothetical protein